MICCRDKETNLPRMQAQSRRIAGLRELQRLDCRAMAQTMRGRSRVGSPAGVSGGGSARYGRRAGAAATGAGGGRVERVRAHWRHSDTCVLTERVLAQLLHRHWSWPRCATGRVALISCDNALTSYFHSPRARPEPTASVLTAEHSATHMHRINRLHLMND